MKTLTSNISLLIALALTPLVYYGSQHMDSYYFMIVMLAGINIILACSLNLIHGITGQFSLGHAGFMAVGAYVSASCSYYLVAKGHPPLVTQFYFLLTLLAGGGAAALCGWLVGLPSLRLRGDYLAIVTLGFGEIIRVCILNIDAVGGARGFTDIPQHTNSAWVYTAVCLTLFSLARIARSGYGRAFKAIRDDEIAAESIGIETTKFKVLSFVVSSFFAGIAGGLFAHFYSYINPSTFTFTKSFEIIIMVVLGGMGSLSGSTVAAIFLTILPEALRPLKEYTGTDYRMVIYALLLIVTMLTRPRGLFGRREFKHLIRDGWRKWKAKHP